MAQLSLASSSYKLCWAVHNTASYVKATLAIVGWWHAEQVCGGLEEAVQTLKLNEVAEVIVQPQYGFGDEEHQVPEATIPANSTLFYTVELAELSKVPLTSLCYSRYPAPRNFWSCNDCAC